MSLLLLAAQPSQAAAPPHTGLPFDNPHGIRECAGLPSRVDAQPRGGRPLYAAPNERSARIGRLLPQPPRHGAAIRPTFPLVESFGGWLLVKAGIAETRRDAWLLGLGVSTGVSVDRGYSYPSTSSEIVMRSRDGARLDAHAELIDILACDHDWILGRWRIDAPDKLSWRQELEMGQNPPMIEIWTPACDRRSPGCDAPPGTRPPRTGPRDPVAQSGAGPR